MSGGPLGQPGVPQPMEGVPPEALKGAPDPSTLPPGHPLRKLADGLGVTGPQGAQSSPQVGMQPLGRAMNPQPFPGPQAGSQGLSGPNTGFKGVMGHGDPAARADDPLARPFTLPSGGLAYEGVTNGGQVLIAPMRGEQQEIMSGAGDGLAASPVFRHVVQSCVNCQGIAFGDITMEDFGSLMLNVIALSMGDETIPMMPTCTKCQHQFDGSKRLTEWPARLIRPVQAGENVTWPPDETESESEDARILREMGLTEGAEAPSPQTIYTAAHIEEPWMVELGNGQTLGLRYLRVRDWELAEEYAERSGSTGVSPDAALGRFLRARSIASMDGKKPGMLPLMEWARQAPMPLLVELDNAINKRTYGYVLDPMFRCPRCSHRFRQQLPLSGEMLHRHSAFS